MKVSPAYYPLKFVKIPTIFLPDFVTPNDIVIPAKSQSRNRNVSTESPVLMSRSLTSLYILANSEQVCKDKVSFLGRIMSNLFRLDPQVNSNPHSNAIACPTSDFHQKGLSLIIPQSIGSWQEKSECFSIVEHSNCKKFHLSQNFQRRYLYSARWYLVHLLTIYFRCDGTVSERICLH